MEFGQDVYNLSLNLRQLQGVFDNVRQSAGTIIPGNSSFHDVSSLNAILDEPHTTIYECQQLLSRRDSFKEQSGAIRNIYWNTFIESEVAQLHDKIKFHNVKILALLKPLELKLLLDIRSLVVHYGESILRELERQNQRLFGDGITANATEAVDATRITVPEYLQRRFEFEARDAKPGTEFDASFPMHDGINAFLLHYQEDAATITYQRGFILSNPTQSPEQYLNMMKSIWIIQKVLGSWEYIETCRRGNRLLKCFVEDLGQKCLDVFNRYSAKPDNPYKLINEPNEMSLLPLGNEAFIIWPRQTQAAQFDLATLDTEKTILRAPLQHPRPPRQLELLVLRQAETTLEMIIKESSEQERIEVARSRDIDLKLATLHPIYADPQNMVNSIDVGLYTQGTRGRDDLLRFQAFDDLYLFQEAITGYRVVRDIVGVDVVIRDDASRRYVGRMQIWDYQAEGTRMNGTSLQGDSRRQSLAPTVTSRRPSNGMTNGSSATIRRTSASPTSPNMSMPSPISPNMISGPRAIPMARGGGGSRGSNGRQTTLSPYSASPDSYATSTGRTANTWNSGSNGTVHSRATQLTGITALTENNATLDIEASVFEVPKDPLLVMFLRPVVSKRPTNGFNYNANSGGSMSIIKIPIGHRNAKLDLANCDCNAPTRNPSCLHSGLKGVRQGGLFGGSALHSHLFTDERMVNLAAVGRYYATTEGSGTKIEDQKLNFARFTFGRKEDKDAFGACVEKGMKMDQRRWDDYRRAIAAVRR